MNRYLFFANGSSGNHGCEAIARSMDKILDAKHTVSVLSNNIVEDNRYGLNKLLDIFDIKHYNKASIEFLKAYYNLKVKKDAFALDLCPYEQVLKKITKAGNVLALSLGGDNYCYGGTAFYKALDTHIHRHGIKTAMVGCSIEPDVIKDPDVKADLAEHSLIIARESITYSHFQKAGLRNIALCPDPAFVLDVKLKELPIGFIDGNTVGLNLSPVVGQYGGGNDMILKNADNLINNILSDTDMNVALIPHVIWDRSNDMDILRPLFDKFEATGRVVLIEDCNAEELKGYISRCRFLVTARTHASIAAYSTCVPTLVIGYSVKAVGIAQDIFGTSENYVLPTQQIDSEYCMLESFKWLMDNEQQVKRHLNSFMPAYCDKAFQIKELIAKID